MKREELRNLSVIDLLYLYEDFVKMWHYEAVDEFKHLRELEVTYYDIQDEIKRRMG